MKFAAYHDFESRQMYKELIIKVLEKYKKPMTATDIRMIIRDEYGIDISPITIGKLLNSMLKEGKVKKIGYDKRGRIIWVYI